MHDFVAVQPPGVIAVAGLAAILLKTIWLSGTTPAADPRLQGATDNLGKLLFNYHQQSPGYLLPFEIVSLILLVAMIGVIILSKKDLK